MIQELGGNLKIAPLKNMYVATIFAVVLGGAIAMLPEKPFAEGGASGKGGLLLWPLFGATNQLLAGLALMVTTFYLWRRNKPVWFVAIPMVIMIVMPGWALVWQLFNESTGWCRTGDKPMLAIIGLVTFGLQIWMVIEAIIVWPRARGILEEALPAIKPSTKLNQSGGRSC